jgi:hypothetical protein
MHYMLIASVLALTECAAVQQTPLSKAIQACSAQFPPVSGNHEARAKCAAEAADRIGMRDNATQVLMAAAIELGAREDRGEISAAVARYTLFQINITLRQYEASLNGAPAITEAPNAMADDQQAEMFRDLFPPAQRWSATCNSMGDGTYCNTN